MTLARLPSDGPLGAATAFWRSLAELERCDIGELDGVPIIRRFWPGRTDEMRHWIETMLSVLKTREWRPVPRCVIRFHGQLMPEIESYGKTIELTWDESPSLECRNFKGWVNRIVVQDGNKWPHMLIDTSGEDGRSVPDIQVEFPRFKA